jgi:hypothetical protein
MLSRALSLATVTLLIGCLTAVAVRAVENLEAGKSPAQIFAGTCNACHKSPRGLLRSVPASSLSGFLRQHYTTSSDMANVLASYLVSNGATDTRVQKDAKEGKQGKDGKEAAKEGKQEARAPAEQQPAAKQPARLPRPGESPDIMRPDQPPSQAAIDKGKKGKKGREEPARTEPVIEPPKETAKGDDSVKPEAEPKTESAKVEPAKPAGEPSATRQDPVPAVTPAPSVTAAAPATSTPVPATSPPPAGGYSSPPVQALDGPSAPSGEQPKPSVPVEIKAPAVAAAPALPPVPPAGPPTVPISQ